MIQTVVTPNKSIFDMEVSLPENYIGKIVNVIFYIDEEVKKTTTKLLPEKKPSDFFGTLSEELGDKMHVHANKVRNEWN